MDIHVGDVLKLKKQHPCGSNEWEVLRVGADFRLKCKGCEHQIMIARRLLEKNIKQILNHIKKITKYPCYEMEFAYPITDAKKAEITKLVFEDKKLPKTPHEIKFVSYEDGAKFTFENGYWGVIRFSGNENVVRIFSEMQDKKTCAEYIKIYEDFIGVKERQV